MQDLSVKYPSKYYPKTQPTVELKLAGFGNFLTGVTNEDDRIPSILIEKKVTYKNAPDRTHSYNIILTDEDLSIVLAFLRQQKAL